MELLALTSTKVTHQSLGVATGPRGKDFKAALISHPIQTTTLRVTRAERDACPLVFDILLSPTNPALKTNKFQRSYRKLIKMSSTPSSRRRGHSSRNSQSSTPTQQPQATPRSTRQAPNGNAVPSSSPLFFQSSPARQTPAPPSQLASDGMIISSPPRNSSDVGDREGTPRPATRPIDGMLFSANPYNTL
jgi:hypothetical protein